VPGLARTLEQVWYERRPVPLALAALEHVYRGLLAARRLVYRLGIRRARRLPVPVLVIGNLTVGGTGKTPLTQWLARELSARGWQPGVVLRGYGGSARGAQRVRPDSDARDCGDEALLLARSLNVPVAIAARRADAGSLLCRDEGVDLVIADDGLQHWSLARDLEVVVVDGARGFGNGRLLPAGPLREPVSRLGGCDFAVLNLAIDSPTTPDDGRIGVDLGPDLPTVAMRVRGTRAISMRQPGLVRPLSAFAAVTVHAVAAIGNPERYFRMLEAHGLRIERHAFPDHHPLRPRDLEFPGGQPVLITEKDAVKLSDTGDLDVWVVPVEAVLPASFADAVHARLHALRERNRGGAGRA